jgi:hypothetical protein
LEKAAKMSGTSRVTLILAAVIAITGCCTLTKSETSSRLRELEQEHIAFIDAYTAPSQGSQVQWDEANFQAKVQTINQGFATAASDVGIRSCPARKQFVENSSALFKEDASFIETHHSVGSSFAEHKKEQIRQNYDSFLNQ